MIKNNFPFLKIKKNIVNVMFVFFILFIVLGFVYSQSYFSVALVFLTYLFIGNMVNCKSSVHMMFFLGYTAFIFLPSLLNWYYLDVSLSLFFITSLVSSLFLFITRGTEVKYFINYGVSPRVFFVSLSFLSIMFVFLGLGNFVTPVFSFLIVLLSLCFQQGFIRANVTYLFVFIFVLSVYLLFYWNGFGRLLIVGWLLLALLQFFYSIGFKINKYAFGLLPGLGSTFLADRDFLQLKFSGFEKALYDSAYGPYRTASSFIDSFNQHGFDVAGFWDQIMFTFFVFIPRSVWPSKPLGFGYEYTVQNLNTSLIDAGHSIAGTLISFHIYYLGYLGIVTSLLFISIIAFATNVLYRIKGLNGNGVLIFSASMMALVWGGMSSFSARVALSSIVFVLLFTLFRRFLTRKVRFVWGASN